MQQSTRTFLRSRALGRASTPAREGWLSRAKQTLTHALTYKHDAQRDQALLRAAGQADLLLLQLDGAGRAVSATESWRAFTGQAEEDAHGQGYLMAVHDEDRAVFAPPSSTSGSTADLHGEVRIWSRAQQRHRLCVLHACPLRSAGGATHGWVAALREAEGRSGLQLFAEQSSHSERSDVFVHGLIQVLNAALQGIVSNTEVIAKKMGSAVQKETTSTLLCVERILDLRRKLMAAHGLAELHVRTLSAADIAHAAQQQTAHTLQQRTKLELCVCDNAPTVLVDERAVLTILENLVANAEEALPLEGGTIHLVVSFHHFAAEDLRAGVPTCNVRAGWWCRMAVSDAGEGMDEAVRARMFDPFFTTRLGGRGLGLYVSLGLAKQLGALLQIESAPHQGTAAALLLPIVAPPGVDARPS